MPACGRKVRQGANAVDRTPIRFMLNLSTGGRTLKKPDKPATNHSDLLQDPDLNRLEMIRFPSADARLQAIGVLAERGMLNFSSNRDDVWLVRTPVARKLRQLGVPFDWLTEHA